MNDGKIELGVSIVRSNEMGASGGLSNDSVCTSKINKKCTFFRESTMKFIAKVCIEFLLCVSNEFEKFKTLNIVKIDDLYLEENLKNTNTWQEIKKVDHTNKILSNFFIFDLSRIILQYFYGSNLIEFEYSSECQKI
jgi:hypothetical protein